jgi:hypothetical protein
MGQRWIWPILLMEAAFWSAVRIKRTLGLVVASTSWESMLPADTATKHSKTTSVTLFSDGPLSVLITLFVSATETAKATEANKGTVIHP